MPSDDRDLTNDQIAYFINAILLEEGALSLEDERLARDAEILIGPAHPTPDNDSIESIRDRVVSQICARFAEANLDGKATPITPSQDLP